MSEFMDRSAAIEEAIGGKDVPTLMPTGPQQITIDDRPTGALKVQVHRDIGKVYTALKTIATMSGEDFYYRWPVKNKDGKTDWVEGPSVKCTNAVARQYGNCTVRVRAFDQGQHWMIMAQFVDLETGFALERPFQQRKSQNIGGRMDKDRALDLVFQIGVSKACRNVVANALSEFVSYAFDESKKNIVNSVGKDIESFRAKVNRRLQEMKVPADRVERLIGRTLDKWLAPDIARVIAEIQAVNDGMADVDEMWPPQDTGIARPEETQQTTQPAAEQQQEQQQAAVATKPAETAKAPDPKAEAPKAEAKPAAKAKEKEKPAEKKADAAPAAPAATGQVVPAGETEAAVTDAIRQLISPKANSALLEHLDDQISTMMRGEKDQAIAEVQNVRWNRAYMLRKNELRAGQLENSGLAQYLPQEEQPQPTPDDTRQGLLDWYGDQCKDLDRVTSREQLDALEDSVANELAGDPELSADWKAKCAAKFRAMSRR